MKTTDPTLQAAADAAAAFHVPAGVEVEGFRLPDFVSDAELEQLVAVVRAAIAAPVLALHTPNPGTSSCRECFADPWPCPTVRALGVAA